ncbi:MAG TPA: hypothetical protein VMI33_16895 [Streptosporangiaceae bacterium]|nr:hypothetical protein [Streptosporangiaceae bacterium]
MGLPFETPGGFPDDDTAPDAGRYHDLTTPDYDGYRHDSCDGFQDAAGGDDDPEADLDEDDYEIDFGGDGLEEGGQAGWDPGQPGAPGRM